MTHKKVLERFKQTLDKMETIQEEGFNYSSYVNSCGTTRCICGYYPLWFKRSWTLLNYEFPRLKYKSNDYTEDDLSKFHGIALGAIRALFYGNHTNQRLLDLPMKDTHSSLEEVKSLFKVFYEKLQDDDFYNRVKI